MNPTTSGSTKKQSGRGEPPKWVFGAMNGAMKGVLGSPLHGIASKNLMLITFRGRKSGKQFTTPVGYRRVGDTVLVFSRPVSRWWRNLEGGADVTVTLQGRKMKGRGQVVTGGPEKVEAAQEYTRHLGPRAATMVGMNVDPGRQPTKEELEQAVQGTVLVQVRLRE